jgi:hypothetical protein
MDLSICSDMIPIKTITYRGIVCIDTFPLELVWGKPDTGLECHNCLAYATFKNVLVGLCKNCAMYSYNGKYGKGFFNYPYSNINNNELAYCFGAIHPLHIIHIKGLEYPQNAITIANSDTYSIYNLSLSSNYELSLLLKSPFNIYGLYELQHYYNCDIEVLHMIIDKIKEHKLSFNIWSSDYYNKCLDIEKFYKVSAEDYKIQTDIEKQNETNSNRENSENSNTIDVKPKYTCSYCNIYKFKKELKKCGKCYSVRYCSIACQTRDWNIKHKTVCREEQARDFLNPARTFEYTRHDLENPAPKYEDDSSNNSDDSNDSDDSDDSISDID